MMPPERINHLYTTADWNCTPAALRECLAEIEDLQRQLAALKSPVCDPWNGKANADAPPCKVLRSGPLPFPDEPSYSV
jgi:hypothetical protein